MSRSNEKNTDSCRQDRSAHAGRRWAASLVGVWAILAGAVSASAQWSTQSPLPTHLAVRGVAAPSANHLFLATDDDSFDTGGALFESLDAGATWAQRAVPFDLSNGLYGVFFLDSQHGWVWGNVNYRTVDGGATWQELPLLGSAYAMEFYTSAFGVTSGNFGTFVSRDGGLTWEPSPAELATFSFASASVGLGAGPSGISRTVDGGATFASVRAGVAEAVAFLSPTTAVAIADGTLVRSTDGGTTWTAAGDALGRNRLFVVSSQIVLAWGRSGAMPDFDDRLLRSTDGGATWTDLGEPIDGGPLAGPGGFVGVTPAVVVASDGAGGLYRSADGGATWAATFVTPGPVPMFLKETAPVFADATTGYFGFGPGFVVGTTDGGLSWQQISSGSGTSVLAMDRFANGDLIAVGESGQVLTNAGGNGRWRLRTALGGGSLVAVQVVGAQAVVVVDQSGRLYRSLDGGANWTTAAATPPNLSATGLFFESTTSGWVVGQGFDGAALFRTTDGGATWSPAGAFQGTYVAVDFVGANGWAAATYGVYQRTTNGGLSWSESSLPGSPASVLDLDFWDASTGYAVGTAGYVARSSDGGATWEVLPTPPGLGMLSDIVLLGPDTLWISSTEGEVLFSSTGGANWSLMDAGPAGFGAYDALAASPAGDAWLGGWQGVIRRFAGPPPPPVNRAPVALFHYLTTGMSVAFTDRSTDSDGSIVSWSWQFGDGASSSDTNPVHLFAVPGSYNVFLTVTDDDGDSAQFGKTIVVQPGPGGTFGEFTEATPIDAWFVTPQDEDFWVSSAASADYDGDGDLDLALFGYYVIYNTSADEHLLLLRNDGRLPNGEWEFSYTEVPLGTLSSGSSDLAWGDADGDGDPDLVVGSQGQTVLYRNAAGTLVPTATVLPGYWEDNGQADFDLRSITWADFDNDGDLDLLLPSIWDEATFSSRTALMRNDGLDGAGGWIFTEMATDFGPSDHAQTSWADMDGDQDLDLLIVHLAPNTGRGFIRRFRNDGGGVFTPEDILGTLSVEHGEAQWGDYDDDGDLDILVAGNVHEVDDTYATVLRVYRNDAETYVPFEVISCLSCDGWFDITAATWADYDSDGDIDILLAGTYNSGSQIEGRARVYDNVGGLFVDSGNALPAPRAMGSSGGSFSWLDIDGEGDLDYFIAGSYFVPGGNGLVETQMHLYINDAQEQNLAPSSPAQLDAQVALDGEVALWWQPAADDLTPAAALTYDLRLYRGGVAVSAGRRGSEPGGLGAVGAWTLSGLPDGAYTWTLQAVDSAYNSGPVASGNFFVGTPPTPLFADGFEFGSTGAWSAVVP